MDLPGVTGERRENLKGLWKMNQGEVDNLFKMFKGAEKFKDQ